MKSNLSAKETLLYNDREKSEVIFIKNLTSENVFDVERQMAVRQKLFTGRAKNLTAHIIVSPSVEDGKRQTRLDWKEIGESFLKKAGLTSYQSIAYLHKDKEHFHLHMVANRIDINGKIYRHKNELALSQRLGDEIAMERGLKRAAEVRRERKLERENGVKINPDVGIVAQIRKVAAESVVQAWGNGVFDQGKYFKYIKAQGYDVKCFFKKENGELRGYAIGKRGERLINASQIGPEFTLRKLKQEAPDSKPSLKLYDVKVQEVIEESFQKTIGKEDKFEPQLFLGELRSAGYTVKEYYNKDTGKLRGYGLEINNRIVNASEIGPEFTLTNLKKRLEQINQSAKHRQRKPNWKTVESEPEVIPHYKEEEEISRELKRTIDIQLLTHELRDLTSGHRYQSQDDFIKALEEKGYHVHLRYDGGHLSGFTIHKGTEHYHDKEIGNGEFGLHKLIKHGTVRNFNFETRDKTFQTGGPIITGTPCGKYSTSSKSNPN